MLEGSVGVSKSSSNEKSRSPLRPRKRYHVADKKLGGTRSERFPLCPKTRTAQKAEKGREKPRKAEKTRPGPKATKSEKKKAKKKKEKKSYKTVAPVDKQAL